MDHVSPAPDTDLFSAADAAPPLGTFRLSVVEGPDRPSTRLLRGIPVVAGTAPYVDWVLSDGTVSRRHARLSAVPGGVEVRDLGSKNGLWLAGGRVIHACLPPGSAIRLGRTVIQIACEQDLGPTRRELAGLHGQSPAMQRLYAELERLAEGHHPVILEGEAGVGKARAARALHRLGAQAAGPCVVVEARDVGGRGLSAATPVRSGTVIVTQVELLSEAARGAVLGELEAGLGTARIIGTTRRDLNRTLATTDALRSRLAQLGLARVRVPPLRERGGDLLLLIDELLLELGAAGLGLGPDDLGELQAQRWPENIRELRRTLARRVVTRVDRPGAERASEAAIGTDLPYKVARGQLLEAFEREYTRAILARAEGNISQAARVAGIDRVYLHRLIRKYGL